LQSGRAPVVNLLLASGG